MLKKFSLSRGTPACIVGAVWPCNLQGLQLHGWLGDELNFLCQVITLAFIILAIYNFVLPQPLPTYVLEST